MSDRESNLLSTMQKTTWKLYVWVGFLLAVVLLGVYAHSEEVRLGLGVTGLGDQFSWGINIINFVFFLSISIAGTLISAVLRLTNAGWRRPITRMAESITLVALFVGVPMVLIDLGRPERMMYLFRYPRIQSPLIWDVLVINTYLVGCLIYYYLLLVPDLALLAARPDLPAWRRRLYLALTGGWKGGKEETRLLERSISVMAVTLLPLAILTHTVLAWIFSTTLRAGWNSSIFGPYFVIGAIYGGSAAVILAMFILRRVFHLEQYLGSKHFRNVGYLLLTFSLLYVYFNLNEYLTIGYSSTNSEKALLERLFWGEDAVLFWSVNILGVIVPVILVATVLIFKRYREFVIPGVAVASCLAVVGAWAKRYLIVVPTLANPYLPAQGLPPEWAHYHPSWVEWSITAAAVAAFLLLFTILAKLFPVVSVWETRETEAVEEKAEERAERAAPVLRPQPYLQSPLIVALIGAVLVTAISARAQQPAPQGAQPAAVSLEWEALPPGETAPAGSLPAPSDAKAAGSRHAYFFVERMLTAVFSGGNAKRTREENPVRPMAITARVRDAKGAPLAYQPVGFALQASFGSLLEFGKLPTDEQGKAKLVLRDRRCGKFLVKAAYAGSQAAAPSSSEAEVDFGLCSPPGLPAESVFITPYPSAFLALGSMLFFGTIWGVFLYAFGYLFWWHLHHSGKGTAGL